jgi:hypothetical protein
VFGNLFLAKEPRSGVEKGKADGGKSAVTVKEAEKEKAKEASSSLRASQRKTRSTVQIIESESSDEVKEVGKSVSEVKGGKPQLRPSKSVNLSF